MSFKSGLMKGKKGLVMGVANDHSLAWGIADVLNKNSAELAFTYQGETLLKRVGPLAKSIGSEYILKCDVCNQEELEKAYEFLKDKWGGIDFLVHAIAYSDKNELNGRYLDTSKENFLNTMEISCFSFTQILRVFEPLLTENSSVLTLTYGGSERVIPNYNVMGVDRKSVV